MTGDVESARLQNAFSLRPSKRELSVEGCQSSQAQTHERRRRPQQLLVFYPLGDDLFPARRRPHDSFSPWHLVTEPPRGKSLKTIGFAAARAAQRGPSGSEKSGSRGVQAKGRVVGSDNDSPPGSLREGAKLQPELISSKWTASAWPCLARLALRLPNTSSKHVGTVNLQRDLLVEAPLI